MRFRVYSLSRASMFALAALFCLFPISLRSSASAQTFDRIERERARDMLSAVKDDIKKNYYDTTYHGIDVDARFKAADEKMKQATSLGQSLGIIAQALLDFNDSHLFFMPPARPETIEYGWRMQMIGDKCFVIAVKPGSDAAAKGLKVGDVLTAVNGFKPSRKEFWKMEYYYYGLSPRASLLLDVQSPDGQQRQLEVAANVRHGKRVVHLFDGDGSDLWQMMREQEEQEHLDRHRFYELGNVVVWKMPGFSYEPEQADSLMGGKVKGRSALILDLRGNPGGYVKTLEQLTGNFFERDLKIAELKGRKEMKPIAAKTHGSTFKGKLIVLVDSKSASCAELFARLVQLEKRGIVIGDQTAGAVMQAKWFGHESGVDRIVLFGASITNADVIMSDGQSVEHIGVTPDELMIPTAEDLAAGRDPVLAHAVELAGAKIDPLKAGALFPVEWPSTR